VDGSILRTLRAIDWDFARPRSGYVPPPHWYPGTFVPALSDALIEALTPVGGKVFDPYGGIGTTGWSAIRTGRSCHVADVNPVASLISYATTTLLALRRSDSNRAYAALGALGQAVGRNDDLFGEGGAEIDRGIDDLVGAVSSPEPADLLASLIVGPPNLKALGAWIAPETLNDIDKLSEALNRSQAAYVRLLGYCMLSAVLRSVSSQHASWGHIADNVLPREMTAHSVTAATTRWLKRTKAFVGQAMLPVADDPAAPLVSIHRRNWSVRAADGPADADLLLTSPPYADAIDYTLAQRLSLYLLGHNDASIRGLVVDEIGARRKRTKSTSRAIWSELLCSALIEQVSWLKPKSSVCLVLPHKDSGRSGGETDLKVTLERLGWDLAFEQDRSIHQSHTRQSWTSIKKETILVFDRDSGPNV
jgi:hypothetical protein